MKRNIAIDRNIYACYTFDEFQALSNELDYKK